MIVETVETIETDRLGIEDLWLRVAPRIGVPVRLFGASFAVGQPSIALAAAQRYVAQDRGAGRCLVLSGNTGVGKSYAAVAALRAAPAGGRRFWYFPALCGAFLDPQRRLEALRETTESPGLVVLDDFGTEYLRSGGLLEALIDEVIWTREANLRPLIITTNLTAEQFKARTSDRIVDRIRGPWGRFVECPGPSLRVAE